MRHWPGGKATQRSNQHGSKDDSPAVEFQRGSGRFARNENHPLDCDLLVIDECSMVDVPLMSALLRASPGTRISFWSVMWINCPRWAPEPSCRTLSKAASAPVVPFDRRYFDSSSLTAESLRTHIKSRPAKCQNDKDKGTKSDFYFVQSVATRADSGFTNRIDGRGESPRNSNGPDP